MLQSVTTPIAYIIKLLGRSVYIRNGCDHEGGSVVSTTTYYRDRSRIEGSTVREALPTLINRVKASRCRNPRDEVNQHGCERDHSFEIPDDVPYSAFDTYLWEVAELLWLVSPLGGVPAVGLDQGPPFTVDIHHNGTTGQYDVRLDVKGGLIKYQLPIYGNPDVLSASAKTPEEALDICIANLRSMVQRQLSLERLVTQFKELNSGNLEHENHPYFSIRQDKTFAMRWRIAGEWYCSIGEDRHRAAINGLLGNLTCGHDAGVGCVLKLNHPGEHQPPQNIRYQVAR